jgi:hypothetical protein
MKKIADLYFVGTEKEVLANHAHCICVTKLKAGGCQPAEAVIGETGHRE